MNQLLKAQKGICEGACELYNGGHEGECELVEVWDGAKSWGKYSYCQNAIKEDQTRGFTVEIIGESDEIVTF